MSRMLPVLLQPLSSFLQSLYLLLLQWLYLSPRRRLLPCCLFLLLLLQMELLRLLPSQRVPLPESSNFSFSSSFSLDKCTIAVTAQSLKMSYGMVFGQRLQTEHDFPSEGSIKLSTIISLNNANNYTTHYKGNAIDN